MMPSSADVLLVIILVLISFFTYWWIKVVERRQTLTSWMPKVPGIPFIGNVFDFGDNTETLNDLMQMGKKYGKMFYLEFLGNPLVVCGEYNFLEFLLSSPTVITKAADYELFKDWLGTGLLISTGSKWKKRRRLLTPAFHFSILEKYIETFERNGNIMVNRLKEQVNSESVDVYPFVTTCTLDIICETAMGVSINAQQNQETEYVHGVKEICRIAIDRSFSFLKGFKIFYVFSKDFYRERKLIKMLHGFTNSVITKRIQEIKEKKSSSHDEKNEDDDIGRRKKMAFLDLLISSTVDGQPLSLEDIREEVDTFMFEGHDTTASAITFAMHLLALHPDFQMRAFEEQRDIFQDDRNKTPTYQDLQNMKNLEDIIKETLRLYPSVPVVSRKTTEETEYKGLKIPKGTAIVAFIYGINRDPEFHENPEKFDPDRFTQNEGKHPYAYIPFSAGPRNCIGQKFAMLEIKTTLSKVLRHLEILPANPEHKMILASEAVLKSRNGIRLRLRTRKW